jgi:uncharacterized protein (TIGR02118 family)
MIIRSAVLEGTPRADDRASFDQHMETTVLTAIASYPGILKVVLRKPLEQEAGAPLIYMVFDLYFPSLQAMHDALASPVRQTVRAQLAQVMAGFEGKVYHLVMQESASAP